MAATAAVPWVLAVEMRDGNTRPASLAFPFPASRHRHLLVLPGTATHLATLFSADWQSRAILPLAAVLVVVEQDVVVVCVVAAMVVVEPVVVVVAAWEYQT